MEAGNNMKSRIEAILFASGEPVPAARLCEVLELSAEEVHRLAEELKADLDRAGSALEILRLGNAYQLCTRSEYADDIRAALEIRRNIPLSQAAFEVLAVIAYNQPVTRAFVEQVRGVDCSGVIASLTEKGLIEEKGRLELPGRPLLYGTTEVFLRCFGLSDLSELPDLPKADREAAEQLTFEEPVREPAAAVSES